MGAGRSAGVIGKAKPSTCRPSTAPILAQTDHEDNSCKPLDVLKHLTGDFVKKKLEGELTVLPPHGLCSLLASVQASFSSNCSGPSPSLV